MDRPRSKRSYHYEQDSDSQTPPRTKSRYDVGAHRRPNHHRRSSDRRQPPPPQPPPPTVAPSSSKDLDGSPPVGAVTTFFRLLCPDTMIENVIGKSGSIIEHIRHNTGAWINVHDLFAGDDERIIEAADDRWREPDGRPPQYSPAQKALLLIHERVVDADIEGAEEEEEDYDGGGGSMWGGRERGRERERTRVTTRLVVPRTHVGCLLGKGGKIIEHMRNETRTHIRILPRDQYTPRCVSMSEEVVQVVGEGRCVKNAVEIISSRLKESLHRDRGPFRGRAHSPDRYFSPDDDLIGNTQYQPAMDGSDIGSRSSAGPTRVRSNAYGPEPSYTFDSDADLLVDRPLPFLYEEIMFRILCPNDKVEAIVSPTDGIIEMLQNDVGVDVRVTDAVDGSEERIILITSDEGPEDELFPAQEALLHLQTHIVDLGPDKDNIITTRLLVSAREIGCFEGKDGLSDFNSSTCANVQILSKEGLSLCASETDEIIQIVGDIQEARKALVQITSKLRSYLYREILMSKETLLPPAQAISHAVKVFGLESTPTRSSSHNEGYQGNDPLASFENVRAPSANWSSKFCRPSKEMLTVQTYQKEK